MVNRILSGVQPTGNIHIGNYLGSIKNWLKLQNKNECLFGVMDLHAITIKQDPKTLKTSTRNMVALYLACGLDIKKSTIFIQSQNPDHAQLCWILSSITPLGWLNRMTQYKEKSQNNENLGLYSYPILMAADILLYNADKVPVGNDQKQHLELTRDIAQLFNRTFKSDYFRVPMPLINENCARIMSLQDGVKKMSKSESSDLTRINLFDDRDLILKKIKKAKTDSIANITYESSRPEISNLINIYSLFSEISCQDIVKKYQNSNFSNFKNDLAELIIDNLTPIQTEFNKIINDQQFLDNVIKLGNDKISQISSIILKDVKNIIGL
jgi:tryptophanyl-tRNA synthetase